MAYRQLEERFSESPESNPAPIPDKPVGRVRELDAINKVLTHISEHPEPLHLWLYGPQGVGKTLCATHTALELKKTKQIPVAISNCWNSNSLYALVNDIIDQFSILRAELQDTRFKIEKIKRHLRDRPCIFIIDEIDRLDMKERNAVLYQFQELANFWIIAISHQSPQKLGIEPRVWSRLSPIVIDFEAYTIDEITDLLKREIETSTYSITPTPTQIHMIAEQSNGDARRAKKLLTQRLVLGLSDIGRPQTSPKGRKNGAGEQK